MAGIASDEAAAMKKGLEAASQEAPAGLPKGLHNLKVVIPPPPKPAKVDKDDDGYSSSTSSDDDNAKAVRNKKSVGDDADSLDEAVAGLTLNDKDDDDDEKILEPLVILKERETEPPHIEFVSRGPVTLEHTDYRFQPYGRPEPSVAVPAVAAAVAASEAGKEEARPVPNVLIHRKNDTDHPTKIDVKIEWLDNHELSIKEYRLPEDVVFTEAGNKFVQIFVQLNPNHKDLKSFAAEVRVGAEGNGGKFNYIGPILISLKTDLAESQEKLLLAEVTAEDKLAAARLVAKKDTAQLISGIGPHKDTVLALLSAQRKNTGQVLAQVHAVVQRLLNHPDKQVCQTVFKLNNNGISPFEIASISNNSLVACYLAEVMYNLIEDTRTALRVLNGKDSQGNTIIHLLARKGDSTALTLRRLLAMRLTDNTKVFSLGLNCKRQSPMHIAVQGKNQPETISILYQAMNRAFEMVDDDGMTPLHYAAQRTQDPLLIHTILSYYKENINLTRKDGLTALDLVQGRPNDRQPDTQAAFIIDKDAQQEICKLLRNNGGRTSKPETKVSPSGSPFSSHSVSPSTSPTPSPFDAFSAAMSGSTLPISPVASPYSSEGTSPRTLPDDAPEGYYGNLRAPGSVESYVQSSPEADHGDRTHHVNLNYSFAAQRPGGFCSMGSPGGWGTGPPPFGPTGTPIAATPTGAAGGGATLEDHLASQIFNEFPEIRNVVGQIIDGNL